MAVVEGEDERGVEALGEGDDGGVDAAEREVGVLLDQLGYAGEILGRWRLDGKASEAPKEACLGPRAVPGAEQLRDLGDGESRDDQV